MPVVHLTHACLGTYCLSRNSSSAVFTAQNWFLQHIFERKADWSLYGISFAGNAKQDFFLLFRKSAWYYIAECMLTRWRALATVSG